MKKLKSNDKNAPLQFVSPYTQMQCLDRIQQQFGDTDDKLEYIFLDDMLIKFRIYFEYGSIQFVAKGSLSAWAAGEQTRVICQVQSPETTKNPIELASNIFVEFFKTRQNDEDLNRGKAESQLYDRLILLLAEPESLDSHDHSAENIGAPPENRFQKVEDAVAPLQLNSPYPPIECIRRLRQHFGDTNDRLKYTVIDGTLVEFKIQLEVDSKQYVVIGNLKAGAEGAKTRLNCKVQSLDNNGEPHDATSHADVSSQFYDRLTSVLSAPEKS